MESVGGETKEVDRNPSVADQVLRYIPAKVIVSNNTWSA